jgi:hypothetical protein
MVKTLQIQLYYSFRNRQMSLSLVRSRNKAASVLQPPKQTVAFSFVPFLFIFFCLLLVLLLEDGK